MARKVKQNKDTIIEGGLQAALKMAGLVPANETTSVTDVVEKTTPAIEVPEVPETKWGSYMEVPVPEKAIPTIEKIHKDFLKEVETVVTTTATTVAPAVAAVEVQEAVLPKPEVPETAAGWVIKAAAQLRFKSLKAQQSMSFRDIFKSKEQRASEDALLLAQAEEEIRLELAAR